MTWRLHAVNNHMNICFLAVEIDFFFYFYKIIKLYYGIFAHFLSHLQHGLALLQFWDKFTVAFTFHFTTKNGAVN